MNWLRIKDGWINLDNVTAIHDNRGQILIRFIDPEHMDELVGDEADRVLDHVSRMATLAERRARAEESRLGIIYEAEGE